MLPLLFRWADTVACSECTAMATVRNIEVYTVPLLVYTPIEGYCGEHPMGYLRIIDVEIDGGIPATWDGPIPAFIAQDSRVLCTYRVGRFSKRPRLQNLVSTSR